MDEKNQCLELLDLLGKALGANRGTATDRERCAEGLANKFFNHAFFVLYLARGGSSLEFPSGTITISGVASVDVLTRAAFEAFLTFHYVFYTPKTEEDRNCKYWAYKLAGLVDRRDSPATSERHKEVLTKDKEVIGELSHELHSNTEFQSLSDGQQKEILKGRWRLRPWRAVAEDAGLDKMLAVHMYSHLSGFAHSSSLSVLQAKLAYKKHEETQLIEPLMTVINILTANMIHEYCELFAPSTKALESDQKGLRLVDWWMKIGHGNSEALSVIRPAEKLAVHQAYQEG